MSTPTPIIHKWQSFGWTDVWDPKEMTQRTRMLYISSGFTTTDSHLYTLGLKSKRGWMLGHSGNSIWCGLVPVNGYLRGWEYCPRGPSLAHPAHLAIRLRRSLHGLRFVDMIGSCYDLNFNGCFPGTARATSRCLFAIPKDSVDHRRARAPGGGRCN